MPQSLRSPSLRSPSPSFSESSGNEESMFLSGNALGLGPSASRPGSPRNPDTIHLEDVESDSVTCLWDDCGKVFTHLPTLISHIHDGGLPNILVFTNRIIPANGQPVHAVVLHRHLDLLSFRTSDLTLEKNLSTVPFLVCPLAWSTTPYGPNHLQLECDKSFTRSDALAKHLRLQHNIEPPAPGRGGYRKRKRGTDDQGSGNGSTSHAPPPGLLNDNSGTFNTFKFEPSPYPDDQNSPANYLNGHRRSPSPHHLSRQRAGSPEYEGPDDDDSNNSGPDVLPEYLQKQYDPETQTIQGRSPAMVMYLLMKAKHRYALEQHESLLEELRLAKLELQDQRDRKDAALDQLLGSMFEYVVVMKYLSMPD
ncbi:hypothetical protein C0989_003432 [Termitomyces sp. Mn162]|nr:hypothetical protein C0989_003432 [Termitomyces sp. Mn162]